MFAFANKTTSTKRTAESRARAGVRPCGGGGRRCQGGAEGDTGEGTCSRLGSSGAAAAAQVDNDKRVLVRRGMTLTWAAWGPAAGRQKGNGWPLRRAIHPLTPHISGEFCLRMETELSERRGCNLQNVNLVLGGLV